MNLFLFHTVGCHLCDLAEAELSRLPSSLDVNVICCDVAESDIWMELYDVRIPVVKLEYSDEDLGWPFTVHDITLYIERNRNINH